MKTKIPSSKLSRSTVTGVTAVKLSAKHISFLGRKVFQSDDINKEKQEEHEKEMGKLVFAAMAQLRGAALKLSQMLSMESDLLPESIRRELAQSCYSVAPLNRALIRKVFVNEFGTGPEKIFKKFDANAFAAASLGQVHNAEDEEGRELAVKIQYPGIGTTIESDMKIIRGLTTTLSDFSGYIPKKDLVNFVMDEIEHRLVEEVDYEHEAESTQWFKENLKLENVIVPTIVPKYCGKKVICFEKLDGFHLKEWLATNPTQEERNHFGQTLYDLFWYSFFEVGRLHADPHPGNYLFQDDGKLAVLDYGCTVKLSEEFPDKMKEIFLAHIADSESPNDERIFNAYKSLKVFSDDTTMEHYESEYKPFIKHYQDWAIKPFLVKEYDFSNAQSYPSQSKELSKKICRNVDGIYKDQVYFDRSYMGLFGILRALEAKVKCRTHYLFGE